MQSEPSFTEDLEALKAIIKDHHEQCIKFWKRTSWILGIVAATIVYIILYFFA